QSASRAVTSLWLLGMNRPWDMAEHRLQWRGCDSAGLLPQKMTRSALFLTSPSEQVTSPTPWNAMPDGPWQTEVVVSTQPPTRSAIPTATRWASQVVSDRP